MKIVFMGTPDFAAESLKALIASEHEILAVVTQPDKKKGRGREMVFTPVKEAAIEAGIPVMAPVNINTDEDTALLEELNADIFIVAAFGQILKKKILDMPKYGCINIHASLLPRLRGAAPIQRAILDGDKITGVTIMQMNEGLDTGDILSEKTVDILMNDTGESLHDKLACAGADLVLSTLKLIENGQVIPKKQEDSKASYAGRLDKKMGLIDWNNTADYIERQVRAFYPWPGAYTYFKGKRLSVTGSSLGNTNQEAAFKAGEVIAVNKDSLEISTGFGSIIITEVIPEGKRKMSMKDFLHGYKVNSGEFLG